ncbi:hypothetical protein V8B55DRAFT_1030640 [Mucor lusitanicus]|uniref:DUF3074 domain-containing protein n=2 Tax=Mucor circinelloides f. lusitanicus TaxID=29924 RepID=A0A162Q3W3_MUCCL|nr:hypothetical protein FB192DRAFT_1452997 [Mucor lusitanicus]OAC98699.1 hypothetical protein MUCCIDRAFT_114941 [Mucor lusitanicus CBS 277.49]
MIKPTITLEDLQDTDKATRIINQSFEQVLDLVKESRQWPVIYIHGDITTRKSKGRQQQQDHAYIQRSSIHGADQVTYDQLRSLLYLNHSVNETKYVKQLTDAILLQHVHDEADLFWLGFKTPALSANREFVELVATRETAHRSFMVTSQPVAYDKQVSKQGYVRGAYEAWELVSEIENSQGDKVVEWICIQRSSAGGLIPRFMSDWVAAKDFHHDVEGIIKYIQNNEEEGNQ